MTQIGFEFAGELAGPRVLPKSRYPPSDRTVLGTFDAVALREAAREIRKGAKLTKVGLLVEASRLLLHEEDLKLGYSPAPDGCYGMVPSLLMLELAKACDKCPLNDKLKWSGQRQRFAPPVQIRFEHKDDELTVLAGGMVMTLEVGEYTPLRSE